MCTASSMLSSRATGLLLRMLRMLLADTSAGSTTSTDTGGNREQHGVGGETNSTEVLCFLVSPPAPKTPPQPPPRIVALCQFCHLLIR